MRGKRSERNPWRHLRHRWRTWRWTKRLRHKRFEAVWVLPWEDTRVVGVHFSDGTCLTVTHTPKGPGYMLRKQKVPLRDPEGERCSRHLRGGRVKWARSWTDELAVKLDGTDHDVLFVDWWPDQLEISIN